MLRLVSHAIAFLSIVTAASVPVHHADATLIQVGSRNALSANLDINWSIFGPAGTVLSCFCSTSVDGLTVGINSSSGTVDRFDEGVDYTGNFAKGDALISQPFISDQLTVGSFSPAVSALGTQIQPLDFLGPFTATMHVFTNDGMDGNFTVSGDSTVAEDNSAPFLGVVSTTNDITGVNFFVDIGNPMFPQAGAVAINQMDVRLVPEPGSASVLGTAALVLLIGLMHRRRNLAVRNEA
jgi:hypothetical protein